MSRSLPTARRGLKGAEDKTQLLSSDSADYTQLQQWTPNLDFCVAMDFHAAESALH